MPRRRPTEAERAERREADRRRAQEAVEALRCSEGWQRWLGARRHFHSYCAIILRRRVGLRLMALSACWRHGADGACGRRRPRGGR